MLFVVGKPKIFTAYGLKDPFLSLGRLGKILV
jgi:hypothetical protein